MRRRDLREIARVLSEAGDSRKVYEFLTGILTPQEQDRLALRWRIVQLLERGITQRKIAEKLGVSLCKITRGSRELKHGPKGFRELVREAMSKTKGGRRA